MEPMSVFAELLVVCFAVGIILSFAIEKDYPEDKEDE